MLPFAGATLGKKLCLNQQSEETDKNTRHLSIQNANYIFNNKTSIVPINPREPKPRWATNHNLQELYHEQVHANVITRVREQKGFRV